MDQNATQAGLYHDVPTVEERMVDGAYVGVVVGIIATLIIVLCILVALVLLRRRICELQTRDFFIRAMYKRSY